MENKCITCDSNTCGGCMQNVALLLIRVGLAAIFIFHGRMKVADISSTAGFFASLGLTSVLWAYLVAYVEFIGGICMLIGLGTRVVGVLFAIIMVVAIALVHLKNGFNSMNGGYEFQLLILLTSLAVSLLGSQDYSVDSLIKKMKTKELGSETPKTTI